MGRSANMVVFDVFSVIVLLIVAAVGSALPFFFHSTGRSFAFQMGSMMSGGVMLAGGLVHLLAESMEVLDEDLDIDFPLGPFLCGIGFLATLVVDQIAEVYSPPDLPHSVGHDHPNEPLITDSGTSLGPQPPAQEKSPSDHVPSYTVAVLAVCLWFHSALEGVALGTEEDFEGAVDIFIAICAHKGLAAYALGACVARSSFNLYGRFIMLGTFCVASPIGLTIGYIISTFSDSVTSASFSSAAGGTFLYVALMEVIPRELANKQHRIAKISALIVGFLLMSLVAIWT